MQPPYPNQGPSQQYNQPGPQGYPPQGAPQAPQGYPPQGPAPQGPPPGPQGQPPGYPAAPAGPPGPPQGGPGAPQGMPGGYGPPGGPQGAPGYPQQPMQTGYPQGPGAPGGYPPSQAQQGGYPQQPYNRELSDQQKNMLYGAIAGADVGGTQHPKIPSGNFHLRLEKYYMFVGRGGDEFFTAEFSVVSSDQPATPPGLYVAWLQKLSGTSRDPGLSAVKRFAVVLKGWDPSNKQHVDALTVEDIAELGDPDRQDQKGKELYCVGTDKQTQKNKVWVVDYQWQLYGHAAQAAPPQYQQQPQQMPPQQMPPQQMPPQQMPPQQMPPQHQQPQQNFQPPGGGNFAPPGQHGGWQG